MNLLRKPPMGLKEPRPADDPDHLERVRGQRCCICEEFGMEQLSPTTAHHCIHGRYSQRKAPDCMAIPLCDGHHQGLRDKTKVAIHSEPSRWKRLYGSDTDWISWVEARL